MVKQITNSLPLDNQNNPIPINKEIKCQQIVLADDKEHTLIVPKNAISVRIASANEFELISSSGTSGFICDEDEFGCSNMQSFFVKGIAGQKIFLRWAIL